MLTSDLRDFQMISNLNIVRKILPKNLLLQKTKLRDLKTDSNLLLLKTNMETGHGGASGRYEYYKEVALNYAFLLDQTEPRQ